MTYNTHITITISTNGEKGELSFEGAEDAINYAQWARSRGFIATVYREKQRDGSPVKGSRRYL